jgi:methylated-DNA-[protein]-cysteine S-methyltransferase
MKRFLDRLLTPIGVLALVVDERGALCVAGFTSEHGRMERALGDESLLERSNPAGVTDAFSAYFDGDLSALGALSVSLRGTEFQRSVWAALREIPCGTTWSYRDLAVRIGKPTAVRAVGLANGANPVAVAVPCHRVIGANGSLTGYGAGIARKRWLLEHEGALTPELLS